MRVFSIAFLVVIVACPAYAARMADRVEKTLVLHGADALTVAQAFGFPEGRSAKLTLPWMQNKSLCYKAPGADGHPQTELCDPTPPPINTIEFTAQPEPQITFSGVWYDGTTGSIPDVPRYVVTSPEIDELQDDQGWKFLRDSLLTRIKSSPQKTLRILETDQTLIELSLLTSTGGTWLHLGFDDRNRSDRAEALRKYNQCIESHKQRPLIDGGC